MLFVVIIDIDYFNRFSVPKYKNCPIFSVKTETENAQMFWFKQLRQKAGVIDIRGKKPRLFFKFIDQTVIMKIRNKFGMKRKYLHNCNLTGKMRGAFETPRDTCNKCFIIESRLF